MFQHVEKPCRTVETGPFWGTLRGFKVLKAAKSWSSERLRLSVEISLSDYCQIHKEYHPNGYQRSWIYDNRRLLSDYYESKIIQLFFRQNVCDTAAIKTSRHRKTRVAGQLAWWVLRRHGALLRRKLRCQPGANFEYEKCGKHLIYILYIYIHYIICEHGALIESCGVDSILWFAEVGANGAPRKSCAAVSTRQPLFSPRTRDSSRYSVDLGDFFSRQNIDEKMMRNDENMMRHDEKWWEMMRNDTDRIWSRSAESPSSESWQASYAMMAPFERAVKQAEAIQAEARKSQQWHVNNVPWLPSLHNTPYIIIHHHISSYIITYHHISRYFDHLIDME